MGLTLVEVLIVVAIIGLLAALAIPALSRAEARARRVTCLSNMKQFTFALHLYAQDHDDYLLPNADGKEEALGAKWVEGWLGLPGPDCTNTLYLKRSLVGAYISDPKVWRCPSAEPVTLGRVTQDRARTVSLGCFMGSPVKSPSAMTYARMGDIVRPSPAEALTFIEERVDTINDGSFAMQWAFDESNPAEWLLRDKPSVLHNGSGNLTFADGHVETRRWEDARTIKAPRDDALMPGNPDVLWLQRRGTWRAGEARNGRQ